MNRLVCFLIVGLAVIALQATTVEAQGGDPNMPPPMGDPNMPPPLDDADLGDLDAMSDADLEALFADAPEEDGAMPPMPPGGPGGPGDPNMPPPDGMPAP